jgi:hypothetical protein
VARGNQRVQLGAPTGAAVHDLNDWSRLKPPRPEQAGAASAGLVLGGQPHCTLKPGDRLHREGCRSVWDLQDGSRFLLVSAAFSMHRHSDRRAIVTYEQGRGTSDPYRTPAIAAAALTPVSRDMPGPATSGQRPTLTN